jgi:hypothetical protein
LGAALAAVHVEISSAPSVPEDAVHGGFGSLPRPATSERGPRPQVAIDKEKHNFGTMDSNSTGKHTFVLKNVGQRTLTLTKGETSCKCAMSKIEREDVPPGGSAEVKLEWTGKTAMGQYRETATVKTNDPDRPVVTLTVVGKITRALRASPHEVVFTRVSAGDSATADTRIYGYLAKPLKILGHEFKDPETAKYFSVAFEPLSAGELEQEEEAQSGYLARVTVKPGLPLGSFKQTILAQTNYPNATKLEIPVLGAVDSDIAVVGPNWNSDRDLLTLGTLSNQKATKRKLWLVVRGPHRKQVKFKPIKVEPDLLKVQLGEATEINAGTVVQTPLTIEIPKGTRPVNCLGPKRANLGRVILATQHPRAPELRILIQFAVEGG